MKKDFKIKTQKGFTRTPTLCQRLLPVLWVQETTRRGGRLHTKSMLVCGFTLVEMMVSMAIFAVVLTLAVGSLMSILDGYGRAQALGVASDNINLVMEEMTRNIMQGNKYHCDRNDLTVLITEAYSCSGDPYADSMAFQSFRGGGQTIQYWLDNGVIWKNDASGDAPLTSLDVIKVDLLAFYVFEADVTTTEQPRVVIIMKAEIPGGEIGDEFVVQTTVTQRAINQQN